MSNPGTDLAKQRESAEAAVLAAVDGREHEAHGIARRRRRAEDGAADPPPSGPPP